jgi:hypothetical protein
MKKANHFALSIASPLGFLILIYSGYGLFMAFTQAVSPIKKEFWDVFLGSVSLFTPGFMILWSIGIIATFILLYIFKGFRSKLE